MTLVDEKCLGRKASPVPEITLVLEIHLQSMADEMHRIIRASQLSIQIGREVRGRDASSFNMERFERGESQQTLFCWAPGDGNLGPFVEVLQVPAKRISRFEREVDSPT
ncbi:hypothetical protein L1049_010873 [Liquidambar formosana]|uniref:Uncharacterized protein n=1 Tax=Liquidambar formosana TaxID=63359 RepID=A0AAP0WWN2_LIQFO